MGAGFEAWNAVGDQIFDATASAATLIGFFYTNGQASGSFTDSRLIGRRLISFVPQNTSAYGGPTVTVNSSGVISWQYSISVSGTATPAVPNDLVYYGAY